METYQYKGFEVRKNAKATTIKARRQYSVGQGPLITVIENAPSAGQASKALEDYVARNAAISFDKAG